MSDTIRIDLSSKETEDRFSRFRLIPWWDQDKLSQARILVIGVGALGNEIVKNLALLGIGNLLVADFDAVENSNLSRSILFRAEDNGAKKAETAVRAAKNIYPGMNAHSFHGNIVYDLGLGVYRWADIVLAGLDNREARLAINRSCYRLNTPWIDGGIEALNGVARMFVPPDGPCYECTMSKRDWELLEMRRSCNLLSREEMEAGKVPTTPTASAVIAGVQVQEAVKYLHGLPSMAGKGYVFNGLRNDAYFIEYVRKEECYSHETYEPIMRMEESVAEVTLEDMLKEARNRLGPDAVIELNKDILHKLKCNKCQTEQDVFTSLGRISEEQARCPNCGEMRELETLHAISGQENFLGRTFEEVGIPPYDIIGGRAGMDQLFFEFGGDAQRVLGPLANGKQNAT